MGDFPADIRSVKCGWLDYKKALAINSDIAVLRRFIAGLPKAELHVHIEGTLEPETLLKIARRNNSMPADYDKFGGEDAAWCTAQREKRKFEDLGDFLVQYYACCDVLKTEEDFYDLCMDYLRRASAANVVRAEIFFDPQVHVIERNTLPIETVLGGLHRACQDGKTLQPPVDAALIMCFLRHRYEGSGCTPPFTPGEDMKLLQSVINGGHKDKIIGVGLDSGEAGNPPALFKEVFGAAREAGLHCVAHAGEEGPAAWVCDALDVLRVERVDHGVRALEDSGVTRRLAMQGTPLTVCPCSNHRLQVVSRFFGGENPVRAMLTAGLKVTINGDDPAYFFGHVDKHGNSYDSYIVANYVATAIECGLSADEITNIALNSLDSCFIPTERKRVYKDALRVYCETFKP